MEINQYHPLLITDRGNSGHSLRFYRESERVLSIIQRFPTAGIQKENPDFTKLRVQLYGNKENPVWLDITIDRYKKNRMTSVGFSIDKQQAEMLVSHLQDILTKMK